MKTLKQLIEEKKKELGRTFNWSIFGENSESEKHVQSFLRNAMTESYLSALEDVEGEIEKHKFKHKVDMELYEDSGGGEMCERCGKQGYLDKNEECEPDETNSILSQLKKKIKGLKSNQNNGSV